MSGHAIHTPSSQFLTQRLRLRFALPLLLVLLLFSTGMLGLGYYYAREQVFAGAAAYIRQLEAFASLQETYARHRVEGGVMPILRALEDAGPQRYFANENQRQRLEQAIMAAMPSGQGHGSIRVYLEDSQGLRHATRFIRGEGPMRFVPDDGEVRRAFLAVADGNAAWRTYMEGAGTEKKLTARYYAPVYKRNHQGLRSRFGVLVVEFSLSWLTKRIHAISASPDLHVFLQDSGGAWTLQEAELASAASGETRTADMARLHNLMAAKQTGQTLVFWEGKPRVAAYMPFRSGGLMLGIFVPQEVLLGSLDRMLLAFAAVGAGLLLFALYSLRRTIRLVLRPLSDLRRNAERLSAGDLGPGQDVVISAPAPSTLFGGNPHWPDEPERLKKLSARLRVALWQRQKDLTLLAVAKERLFGEIALARKLQHDLQRKMPETPDNVLLAAELHTAGHIAQDIQDCFFQNSTTLCFITASATAHGVPAALLMDRVMPLLHELLLHGASPAEALMNVNVILHSYAPIDKTEISPFVSVLIGTLSITDGTLTWTSAGRPPPYRIFAGKAEPLPWSGELPLGVKPDVAYRNQRISIRPGETLFFCSGRLAAMPSPSGAIFGEERLLSLLQAVTGPPAKLLESVYAACLAHTHSASPPEDVALLAVRWLGGRQP